jgi:hypothetical protein
MYLAYDNPARATDEAFLIWFMPVLTPSRSTFLMGRGLTRTP